MDTESHSAPRSNTVGPLQEELATVKVFPLIVQFKKDVISNVDTALSWEQLTASDVNFALVRPLVFKYAGLKNPAAPFAALVVRAHFLSLAEEDLAHAGVMLARANLCELLAMKLLTSFASDRIRIVFVLSTSWSPLAGAPESIRTDIQTALGGDSISDDPQNSLEMAIATNAKRFTASPVVQKVVNDLYRGDVVFGMMAHRSVLADNYKPRAIEIYDVSKAPFLDHYRLRVPRYGAILEFINFACLLLTFVACLVDRNNAHFRLTELVFSIFAVSFALEEYTAQKEHGWAVYIASMWNVFDTSFILVCLTYGVFRAYGLYSGDESYSELAFDILSCGACILFPRLAFFTISNNLVVIALRGMIVEFVFFMSIAAICFSGLLFTLWRLSNGGWELRKIAWLLVQVWFGNTYLSFQQAESFHPFFGPILMTCFAALSNTLLLTILISILSNTFARIDANATQEYLFQSTISTIEGVKSDALFSYQPPFNLLAFLILYPASFIITPRRLHTLNVFLIKITSFPTLVAIGVYERYIRFRSLRLPPTSERILYGTLPRQMKASFLVDALMGSAAADVYDAIFDVDAGSDAGLWSDEDGETRSYQDGESSQRRRSPDSARRLPAKNFLASMESLAPRPRVRSAISPSTRPPRSPDTRVAASASLAPSPVASPRKPRFPRIEVDGPSMSPLARLYGVSSSADIELTPATPAPAPPQPVFDVKEMKKLRTELKEVQDRQARIENLLLVLTRGMRNETDK